VQRNDSLTAKYIPPSVESVIESDDERIRRHYRRQTSESPSTSNKKSTRTKDKVVSPGSLEKERKKKTLRESSYFNIIPSSRRQSSTPKASEYSDEDLPKSPGLPRIAEVKAEGRRHRHRRVVSTGSLASNAASAGVGDHIDDMASSTTKDSSRRRSKNYNDLSALRAGSTTAPSTLSVSTAFSGITTASGGSSGSNSTITQDSISRSRSTRHSSRSYKEERRPKSGPKTDNDAEDKSDADSEPPSSSHSRRRSREVNYPAVHKVEKEVGPNYQAQQDWLRKQAELALPNTDDQITPQPSPAMRQNSENEDRDEKDSPSSASSSGFLSETFSSNGSSGNDTTRSSSPEHENEDHDSEGKPNRTVKSSARVAFEPLLARQRQRAATTGNKFNPGPQRQPSTTAGYSQAYPPSPVQQQTGPQSAGPYPGPQGAFYGPPVQGYSPVFDPQMASYPSFPPGMAPMMPPQGPIMKVIKEGESLPPSGYDLLASSLSSSSSNDASTVVPLYRKFEALNNRLLLHLQDEVVELEEELKEIDEIDAQFRKSAANNMTRQTPLPASRRTNAKMGGELQQRRIDVLGRIFVKIGQYSMFSPLTINPRVQCLRGEKIKLWPHMAN
jgi:hypothetical protein